MSRKNIQHPKDLSIANIKHLANDVIRSGGLVVEEKIDGIRFFIGRDEDGFYFKTARLKQKFHSYDVYVKFMTERHGDKYEPFTNMVRDLWHFLNEVDFKEPFLKMLDERNISEIGFEYIDPRYSTNSALVRIPYPGIKRPTMFVSNDHYFEVDRGVWLDIVKYPRHYIRFDSYPMIDYTLGLINDLKKPTQAEARSFKVIVSRLLEWENITHDIKRSTEGFVYQLSNSDVKCKFTDLSVLELPANEILFKDQ